MTYPAIRSLLQIFRVLILLHYQSALAISIRKIEKYKDR